MVNRFFSMTNRLLGTARRLVGVAKRVAGCCERRAALIQAGMLLALTGALVVTAIQTCTLRSTYEATTRPYLAINGIEIGDGEGDWLELVIHLVNYGELPATNVSLEEIRMGGEEMAWTSYGDYVVAPYSRDFPDDLVLLPGRAAKVPIPVHRPTWQSSVKEGTVLEIELRYSWREKQYWYVAKGTFQSDHEWSVSYERGN